MTAGTTDTATKKKPSGGAEARPHLHAGNHGLHDAEDHERFAGVPFDLAAGRIPIMGTSQRQWCE